MKCILLSHLIVWTSAVSFAGTDDKTVTADPAPPKPAPFADRMTGDWFGARTSLLDHGVDLYLDSTSYYQGLIQGSTSHDWEYGGRLDGYLKFDLEKLVHWKGGSIGVHAEYFYGDLPAELGGTVLPTNLGVKLPQGLPDELVFTNIVLTQKFGENVALRLGKINTVDLIAGDMFFGGGGVSRFMNLAFAAPPNGLLPPVIMGGMVTVQTKPLNWTLMVYDPDSRTNQYWADDLFGNGVNISLGAGWAGKVAGRTSSVTLTGIYSTKDGASLGDVLLPPQFQTGQKNGGWHTSILAEHLLHENPERPGEGWGLFLKAGISDGDPTPYKAWITGGIGGKGLIPGRAQDSYGVGGFYHDFSDELSEGLEPLLDFGDEKGLEVYYNFAVTPWFHITADLQVIQPAVEVLDTAVVGALRASVRF